MRNVLRRRGTIKTNWRDENENCNNLIPLLSCHHIFHNILKMENFYQEERILKLQKFSIIIIEWENAIERVTISLAKWQSKIFFLSSLRQTRYASIQFEKKTLSRRLFLVLLHRIENNNKNFHVEYIRKWENLINRRRLEIILYREISNFISQRILIRFSAFLCIFVCVCVCEFFTMKAFFKYLMRSFIESIFFPHSIIHFQ